MAWAGHASTQARHRVHSLREVPFSGLRGFMPTPSRSQAFAHRPHSTPRELSMQAFLSTTGLKVRLPFPIRLSRAETGQICEHHLRKNTTSIKSRAGTTITDHVISPPEKSNITRKTNANTRPMGQMRQKTGNPKMAAERSTPPSTTCRESTGPFSQVFQRSLRSGSSVRSIAHLAPTSKGSPERPLSDLFFFRVFSSIASGSWKPPALDTTIRRKRAPPTGTRSRRTRGTRQHAE